MTGIIEAAARAMYATRKHLSDAVPFDELPTRMMNSLSEQVTAAIAAYEAALWQPIETAPKLASFDVWTSDGYRLTDCKLTKGGNICFIDEDGVFVPVPDATHWRPLPQPPGYAK